MTVCSSMSMSPSDTSLQRFAMYLGSDWSKKNIFE